MNFNLRKKRGQGIVRVSDLFKKYTDVLRAPQGTVITSCIEVIQDIFGVTLKKDQCAYDVHSRILYIHAPGPIKSEIIFQKRKILNSLEMKLGAKSTPKEIL